MTARPLGAQDDAAFDAAHRDMLADRAIQFDLPRVPPEEPPPPPTNLDWLEPVLRVAFWVAVAAIAVFILFLLWQRFGGWRPRRKVEAAPDWRPEEAPARALLADADRLAGEGRFAEAVHMLLHRSVEEMDSKRPDLVRPALTSREIAGLPALPDEPRGAFAAIAERVERGIFAQRPLGPEDWQAARADYERFAFAGSWRA